MGSRAENSTLPAANGKPAETMGLYVAIPTRGQVRTEWALMFRGLGMPLNCTHRIEMIPNLGVVEARNVAVVKALEYEAEFLCFIDDDVVAGNQSLHRLFYLMRKNPTYDLVTAIVTTKTVTPEPCIFRADTPGALWDWKFPDVFPIDACGMAFCMIRMDKVREMEQPWFNWPSGFDVEKGHHHEEGEDIYFCRKLREMGGVLMADGGTLCGHLDEKGNVYRLSETDPPIVNADPGAFEGKAIYSK